MYYILWMTVIHRICHPQDKRRGIVTHRIYPQDIACPPQDIRVSPTAVTHRIHVTHRICVGWTPPQDIKCHPQDILNIRWVTHSQFPYSCGWPFISCGWHGLYPVGDKKLYPVGISCGEQWVISCGWQKIISCGDILWRTRVISCGDPNIYILWVTWLSSTGYNEIIHRI